MTEKVTAGIDGCVINNIYSGYYERVYYAGMPSSKVFSLIYETGFIKEDPNSQAVTSRDALIFEVEHHRQLFYPANYAKEIEFPSRRSCKLRVKSVTPKELTAIVEDARSS